jgi:hypothetical protein
MTYALGSWVVLQICGVAFPLFGLSESLLRMVMMIAALGLPGLLIVTLAPTLLRPPGRGRVGPSSPSPDDARPGYLDPLLAALLLLTASAMSPLLVVRILMQG